MNKTATIDELVKRFLKLTEKAHNGFFRAEPFNGTKVRIERNEGALRIAYDFTETEVAILETLSEVTGVSLNWLVRDALGWTRGYINDLLVKDQGQLEDLLDLEDGACPIPESRRTRAARFLRDVKAEWGDLKSNGIAPRSLTR